jgi:hypothetical protein
MSILIFILTYITIWPYDNQLDNDYKQGTHIVLECMARQFGWLMFKYVYHLKISQK